MGRPERRHCGGIDSCASDMAPFLGPYGPQTSFEQIHRPEGLGIHIYICIHV